MIETNSILKKSKIVNILVSVAIEHENKYLLVEEAKEDVRGLWNFPSGKVHLGEELIDAAKREAREETGYDTTIFGLSGIHYFYWDDLPGVTIRFNFLGKIHGNQSVKLADDVLSTKWFTLSEIEALKSNNKLRAKTTIKHFEEIKQGKSYPLDLIAKP